jgi:hypothetical protein
MVGENLTPALLQLGEFSPVLNPFNFVQCSFKLTV